MAHLGSFQCDFNEAFIFSVCRVVVKDGLSAVPLVQSRLRKYLLQLSHWMDPFLVSVVACATHIRKKNKKVFVEGRDRRGRMGRVECLLLAWCQEYVHNLWAGWLVIDPNPPRALMSSRRHGKPRLCSRPPEIRNNAVAALLKIGAKRTDMFETTNLLHKQEVPGRSGGKWWEGLRRGASKRSHCLGLGSLRLPFHKCTQGGMGKCWGRLLREVCYLR